MRRSFVTLLSIATLVAARAPALAQCGPRGLDRPQPRPELLVSTAWLGAHLQDADLVVIQVAMGGPSEGPRIPGARPADAMAFTVGDHDLPPVATLRQRVEALGISNDSRIVLYGDTWHTGWMFFVLDYLGHGDRTAVLDGGLAQWQAEGRPVESGRPPAVTPGRFEARPRAAAVVDADWVRERLGRRRLVLIDGRSAEEYAGTARESLPRTGHIPGAQHLDWSRTFTDSAAALDGDASRLVSVQRLYRLFAGAGAGPGSELVLYCTVGLRASHLYFVARYLGYDPRMYDGSFSEWSRRADLPVATGTAPGGSR